MRAVIFRLWFGTVMVVGALTNSVWAGGEDKEFLGKPIAFWAQALKEPDRNIRRQAAQIIGATIAKKGVDPVAKELLVPLIGALSDKDRQVRIEAAKALGIYEGEGAVALPSLKEALKDKDGHVRTFAALALWRIDRQVKVGLPILMTALKNDDGDLRRVALLSLATMKSQARPALPGILELLKDEEEEVRAAAARALANIRRDPTLCVPALLEATRDKSTEVRGTAIIALSQFEFGSAPAIPEFIKILGNKDEPKEIHQAALAALTELRLAAAPALAAIVPYLDHKDKDLKARAILALAHLGPTAKKELPKILPLFQDPDKTMRRGAIQIIGNLRGDGVEGVPMLLEAMKSRDATTRCEAAFALWKVNHDPKALEVFRKALKHEDDDIRQLALSALGQIGPAARSTLPAVKESLRDDVEAVRANAAVTLGHLDNSQATIKTLIDLLRDDAVEVRLGAALALAQIGPPARAAVPQLEEALRDPRMQDPILRLLGEIGPAAAAAVPTLLGLLKKKDNQVNLLAARTLGLIGPEAKSAVPRIMELVKEEESDDVRITLMDALARIGPNAKESLELVRGQLKSGDSMVRVQAAETLWKVGKEPGVVAILGAALKDPERRVRSEATWVLGTIGPDAKEVVGAIEPLLKDADPQVRLCAAYALWKIAKESKASSSTFALALPHVPLERYTFQFREEIARTLMAFAAADRKLNAALIDLLQSNHRLAAATLPDLRKTDPETALKIEGK